MQVQRIVSMLPSATELIYELGFQDNLFGVTHECIYPEEAKSKPKIISSVFDSEKLQSGEIDEITCKLIKEGKEIFKLNEENLKKANPDLIVSQNTCQVCAAHTNHIFQAQKILQKKPKIFSMDPHNLNEILDSVVEFSKIISREEQGVRLKKVLQKKIEGIKNYKFKTRPKVLAIEWIDPLFSAGHWVPDIIELAGGENLISKTGKHSKKITMEEIIKVQPEIIVIMPCGFNTQRTVLEYNSILKSNKNWNQLQAVQNKSVYAVNANSFFSKPSIRTIIGLHIMARIIHPDLIDGTNVPKSSFALLN